MGPRRRNIRTARRPMVRRRTVIDKQPQAMTSSATVGERMMPTVRNTTFTRVHFITIPITLDPLSR
jgi:hypothetical protein